MTAPQFVAYYRVSTPRQGISGLGLEAQQVTVAAFVAAKGGETIAHFTEIESGSRSSRPVMAAALATCKRHGAVLLIAKLDRLARNVSFVSGLMEAGVDFIACDMPMANRVTIHILAAVAEHELKGISERTIAGLAIARQRGRVGGNPRLRAREPAAIDAARAARIARYEAILAATLSDWLPVVSRLRPAHAWDDVANFLNSADAKPVRPWSADRLRRAAAWSIANGHADPAILGRAPQRDTAGRLLIIAEAIQRANPALSLREIGRQLEALRERTPRGGTRWAASSVKHLLDKVAARAAA